MPDDPACEAPADLCAWTDGVTDGVAPGGWCNRACNSPADCPLGTSGNAMPQCTYYGKYGLRCFLQCRDGAICPDGMSCVDVLHPNEGGEYDHICIWPAE